MTVATEPGPVTVEREPVGDGERPLIGGDMRPRRFALSLSGIVLFGLGFRVGYVLIVTRYQNGKLYDAFWYGVTANELHQGQFFRTPFGTAPTAAHPPLTSLILGSVNFIVGLHAGSTVQRLTEAVLGAGVVLCVGLIGRAVAGPWVGLVAAGLAAVAPNFWIPSGIVMSETPSMLFMALILLALVRVIRKPTVLGAAVLGVLCAAEALVRAELILFVPFLLVPAVLASRRVSLGRRFLLLGVGLLATALVLAPWVGRNLASFTDPTYISTGDGIALLGANCPATYYGAALGRWSFSCATSVPASGDESVQSTRDQHAAVEYAEHHASRLPVVMLARIGRVWDFYDPVQMATIEVNEGRPRPASLAGLGFYYALLPLGLVGMVILRRRRIPQWFLLVPAGVVTFVAAVVYGLVRFRAPFEVCLVVLAAPALVLAAQWFGRRIRALRRTGHPSGGGVGSSR
jgi:4-amino-4-deoxy-L-arabinose transferase-like glycosyltransferase